MSDAHTVNVKPNTTDTKKAWSPSADTNTTCLIVMCVERPANRATKQNSITTSVRATTVAVVLEDAFTHSGYLHGGINE
jgi:hypothetical protein